MATQSGAVERQANRQHRVTTARLAATPTTMKRARIAYDMGALRRSAIGPGLFADPAWNILLDLFLSEGRGRILSVTAVCIGSRSSSATALRYVTLLVQRGLIDRIADEHDRRRTYVRLTAKGWNAMVTLFEEVPWVD